MALFFHSDDVDELIPLKEAVRIAEAITLHPNNTGMGIQFAAAASVAYERAKKGEIGRELPDDWFTVDLRSWADKGFFPSP